MTLCTAMARLIDVDQTLLHSFPKANFLFLLPFLSKPDVIRAHDVIDQAMTRCMSTLQDPRLLHADTSLGIADLSNTLYNQKIALHQKLSLCSWRSDAQIHT